ncbi:MAG: diguanylate cyclase [Deltaproteobacteria bacterium]|nr:diguanylate cyclase [Deltaproteobacteria bacterium]MCL5278079.1 diguanylate cyclase [Deltaproteobacteria bacterium]
MTRSILIIDDSHQVRNDLRDALEKAGLFDTFYEATDGIKGFRTMLTSPPDLVICDLMMPDFDGFKFLRLKTARHDFDNIPVLIVTGRDNVSDKIRGLEEGAQDYVLKPFNPLELVARVKSHLRIKTLQDELRSVNEKLETLSNTDALTELYNRRYFMNMLKSEFERSKRYNRALSLLMIDIDFFKSINDKCGHLAGDKILIIVSRVLKTGLRKIDTCSRYGGDEFITMLPETDVNGALSVANRYLSEMHEQDIFDFCKELEEITLSIGVACLPDEGIRTMDELLTRVDDALYKAKNGGRNRVAVYSRHR